MADAEPPGGDPQCGGRVRCAAGKVEFRGRPGRAVDHHVCERHPAAEASVDCLEHRVLGGEPSGQAFYPIGPIADLVELGLNEARRNEWVARISIQRRRLHSRLSASS